MKDMLRHVMLLLHHCLPVQHTNKQAQPFLTLSLILHSNHTPYKTHTDGHNQEMRVDSETKGLRGSEFVWSDLSSVPESGGNI